MSDRSDEANAKGISFYRFFASYMHKCNAGTAIIITDPKGERISQKSLPIRILAQNDEDTESVD